MDATNLLFYLPCDSDLTDLCGNTWSTEGSVSVDDRSLNFTGEGYVYTDPPTLGANDFTFSWWEFIPSSIDTMLADTICIDGATGNAPHALGVHFPSSAYPYLYLGEGAGGSSWVLDTKRIGNKIRGEWVHRAIVRSGDVIFVFENGALYASFSFSYSIDVSTSILSIGGLKRTTRRFTGLIKEFQFYDVALWTEDFTPPTDDDYFNLKMELGAPAKVVADFDVETTILNPLKGWRVYNRGFAELLATGGTTVRDSSKSTTGVAFWGGEKSDMFHTPSGLKEIWLRFDLFVENYSKYRDGNHRLEVGHYSPTQSTFCGLLSTFDAGNWVWFDHLKPTGATSAITIERNVLNKFLMHLKSDATDGLVEVFVNGSTTKYTYSGNVNGGEDLDNLRMFCPNAYALFSNVIVSETELTLDDGYCRADFAVETRIAAPQLAVRYQGATHLLPLQTKKVSPALAVRVADKNFYNPLVATDAANASDLRIFLDEQAFALTGGDSFD